MTRCPDRSSRPRRTTSLIGLVGVVALALVAACGSGEQAATPTADPSTTPSATGGATAEPTPEGDGILVPDGLQTGAPVKDLGSTKGKRLFGAQDTSQ